MIQANRRAYLQVTLFCSVAAISACEGDQPSGAFAGGSTAASRGGQTAQGGATVASGGRQATGGDTARGGASGMGGTSAMGGNTATGGSRATGGTQQTGGISATGGVRQTGGTPATGGTTSAGGVWATGGAIGTGGSSATGGTVTPDAGAKDAGLGPADATALVSFKDQILPLMTSKCISCHGATAPKAGIRLDTYASVKANAKAAASEINAGKMPTTGGLPTSDRQMFQAWVNQGMLDN